MNSGERTYAFQGEAGAYSEQAIHKYTEKEDIVPRCLPCDSLGKVIREVESGSAETGIIPVENSIGGYVDRAYRLIAGGDVEVVGEVYLQVRHSLLGTKVAELSEIETVYSHPQALKQCREVLSKLDLETHATYDTAGSAKMIKEKDQNKLAAIASRFAGKKYDLKVLLEDIQSSSDNHTRFLLVASRASDEKKDGMKYKTTVTFELGDSPGALYHCLAPFAEKGINLTMIQSRPTDTGRWEYHFDLEFEGHRSDSDARDSLKRLRSLVPEVQVLGSYPRGDRS
ncbi:prephenate dehydratase [Candidatus Bipolaricaulota bacterium]|nr:prephenate dehydratase [Candidatus Bipolaricaulota bacterium]